jgi:hypothetical protein
MQIVENIKNQLVNTVLEYIYIFKNTQFHAFLLGNELKKFEIIQVMTMIYGI